MQYAADRQTDRQNLNTNEETAQMTAILKHGPHFVGTWNTTTQAEQQRTCVSSSSSSVCPSVSPAIVYLSAHNGWQSPHFSSSIFRPGSSRTSDPEAMMVLVVLMVLVPPPRRSTSISFADLNLPQPLMYSTCRTGR
jgi:hypothetical protein